MIKLSKPMIRCFQLSDSHSRTYEDYLLHCHPLNLPDLNNIITECKQWLSDSDTLDLTESHLWYPEALPKIPSLAGTLRSLNIHRHILAVGIHITMPGSSGPVHIDTGPFDWSLNIPIQGCDDSLLALYETDENPQFRVMQNDVTYLGYESESEMDPYTKIPSHQPLLLFVKKPHNVINPGEIVRIMILIRLKRTFDVESFCNENKSALVM